MILAYLIQANLNFTVVVVVVLTSIILAATNVRPVVLGAKSRSMWLDLLIKSLIEIMKLIILIYINN